MFVVDELFRLLALNLRLVFCLIIFFGVFFTKIALERYKDEFDALTVFRYFAHPLRFDVLEGVF